MCDEEAVHKIHCAHAAAVEAVRARPPALGQPWTAKRLQREMRRHDRLLLLLLMVVIASAVMALILNDDG